MQMISYLKQKEQDWTNFAFGTRKMLSRWGTVFTFFATFLHQRHRLFLWHFLQHFCDVDEKLAHMHRTRCRTGSGDKNVALFQTTLACPCIVRGTHLFAVAANVVSGVFVVLTKSFSSRVRERRGLVIHSLILKAPAKRHASCITRARLKQTSIISEGNRAWIYWMLGGCHNSRGKWSRSCRWK